MKINFSFTRLDYIFIWPSIAIGNGGRSYIEDRSGYNYSIPELVGLRFHIVIRFLHYAINFWFTSYRLGNLFTRFTSYRLGNLFTRFTKKRKQQIEDSQ